LNVIHSFIGFKRFKLLDFIIDILKNDIIAKQLKAYGKSSI